MASRYPNEIDGYDNLVTVTDGVDEIVASHHNSIRSSISKIEETLGIYPQGIYGDVSARLDSFDDYINSLGDDAQVITFIEATDPAYESNVGKLYSKDIDGYTELMYMDAYGISYQLTEKGNSYDRIIGNINERIASVYPLSEQISHPAKKDDYGYVYSYDIDGYTELFYLDNYGFSVQLTSKSDSYGSSSGGSLNDAYDQILVEDGYAEISTINLSYKPFSSETIQLYRNGVLMRNTVSLSSQNDYVWNGNKTLSFFPISASGDWIVAQYKTSESSNAIGENTLDLAYDQGGSGLGREINVKYRRPITLDAGNNSSLRLDGYLSFQEVEAPTKLSDNGLLYIKKDDDYGTSELFFMDNYGQETQITQDGYLATYNSLVGINIYSDAFTPKFESGKGSLYVKEIDDYDELFFANSAYANIQLTSGGSLFGVSGAVEESYTLSEYPVTPHSLDDEFEGSTLDASWNLENATSLLDIDPYAGFSSGGGRWSYNSRRSSWIMVQPEATGSMFLTKSLVLPTNLFVWGRVSWLMRINVASANDANVGLVLAADDGSGNADPLNRITIFAHQNSAVRCFKNQGGGYINIGTTSLTMLNSGGVFEYLGFQKLGSTYYAWVFTNGGQKAYIGSTTLTFTPTRVGFFFQNTLTTNPGNCIFGADFIRFVESATFLP